MGEGRSLLVCPIPSQPPFPAGRPPAGGFRGGEPVAKDVFSNPEGTEEEILAATYRTLVEYGYAELTIQRIGETFGKSPSLVYHHYEGKDELVLACLGFMLDAFEESVVEEEIDEPREHVAEFVGWVLDAEDDPERGEFVSLLTELRSQATHDPAYREHFTRSDAVFERHLENVIEAGIDRGEFRECDPAAVAATIVTLLSGVMLRRSTHEGEAWLADVRTELEGYLGDRVYR